MSAQKKRSKCSEIASLVRYSKADEWLTNVVCHCSSVMCKKIEKM